LIREGKKIYMQTGEKRRRRKFNGLMISREFCKWFWIGIGGSEPG